MRPASAETWAAPAGTAALSGNRAVHPVAAIRPRPGARLAVRRAASLAAAIRRSSQYRTMAALAVRRRSWRPTGVACCLRSGNLRSCSRSCRLMPSVAIGDDPGLTLVDTGEGASARCSCDDPRVQSARTPRATAGPKLVRATSRRMLAGVARGLSDHLGVDVLAVRIALLLLAFAGGAGFVLYAAFWVFVPAGTSGAPNSSTGDRLGQRGQYLALGALTLGCVLAVQSLGLGIPGELLWPLALTGFGVVVLWRQADEAQRNRWRRVASGRHSPSALASTAGGAVLVLAGGTAFLASRGRLHQVRTGLFGTAVLVAGVAIITGPWWLSTLRELSTERRARIREQERAELAAHLHDSVLHTLALIQRHVGDPREVQRLARSQERELRSWLYRPSSAPEQDFGAAAEQIVADVEDEHGVVVELVVVGKCRLDERLASMLQAAREAMVNAARHAGTETISVYVEIENAGVTVFVRDRGRGFDLADVPADRLGVKESIVGRMERNGGRAVIRTSPGTGTEVRLEMTFAASRSES